MTTIAVIGANGYIGKHVVEHMRSKDIKVLAISSQDGSGIDPKTGLLPVNFSFEERLDGVIYAAQSPNYRDTPDLAWHLLTVNSVAPVQAAIAAQKAGARHFVYLSTGNVYEPGFKAHAEGDAIDGTHWYAFSKIQGEQALSCMRTQLQISTVRVFAVYGPNQFDKLIPNLMERVESGKAISLASRACGVPDGGLRINPCFIEDAVDLLTSLACHGGPEILNLAGSQVISVREVAEMWAKLRGLQPIFLDSPTPRTLDLIADTTMLNAYLGKAPCSFEQGLVRMISQLTPATPIKASI